MTDQQSLTQLSERLLTVANGAQSFNEQGLHVPLYHYTNAIGLKGIIETGRLWATHLGYLNDPSERRHGHTVLSDEIDRRLATQPGPLHDDMLKSIRNVLAPRHIGDHECFVTCFCEKSDLLSQWRAYGSSSGYAIGFHTGIIHRAAEYSVQARVRTTGIGNERVEEAELQLPRPEFVQVLYDVDRQTELFSKLLDEAQALLAQIVAADTNPDRMNNPTDPGRDSGAFLARVRADETSELSRRGGMADRLRPQSIGQPQYG
jgi:hypothetical protein